MKVRFTNHPSWRTGDEDWVVPNAMRIVWEGVRKRVGQQPLVGLHSEEAYVPVIWHLETVVIVAMGDEVEVSIRPR